MAHAKRALSEYDQSEQWGMRIRIEMSNAKGSGGGGGGRGGGRGRGRGSGRGDRGGRGRGGRGSAMGGRSAPYPPRGGAPRYIELLQSFKQISAKLVFAFLFKTYFSLPNMKSPIVMCSKF